MQYLSYSSIPVLQPYIPAIHEVCKQLEVEQLLAFGSICTPSFNPNQSDADFIVRFAAHLTPLDRGRSWWALQHALENILARKVDLLMNLPRKNPYLQQEITRTSTLVYEA